MHFDLCLPWYWEYDIDFVQFVEHACIAQGLTLWQITPDNLLESITALYKGEKSFQILLDRSQYDNRFEPINTLGKENKQETHQSSRSFRMVGRQSHHAS